MRPRRPALVLVLVPCAWVSCRSWCRCCWLSCLFWALHCGRGKLGEGIRVVCFFFNSFWKWTFLSSGEMDGWMDEYLNTLFPRAYFFPFFSSQSSTVHLDFTFLFLFFFFFFFFSSSQQTPRNRNPFYFLLSSSRPFFSPTVLPSTLLLFPPFVG